MGREDRFPLWEAGVAAAFAAGLVEVYLSMPDSDYSLLKLPRNLHELQILTITTLQRPEDEHALLCIRSEPHSMPDVGLEHDAYHAEEITSEQLITEYKLRTTGRKQGTSSKATSFPSTESLLCKIWLVSTSRCLSFLERPHFLADGVLSQDPLIRLQFHGDD
ncbi:hypothetical protein ZWY2020_049116 [Hordeum vulgare]|nr:hypothetical protein ZWY2020_049116 [Hordeum vulgare]